MPSGEVRRWRAASMTPHTATSDSCPALCAAYHQHMRNAAERGRSLAFPLRISYAKRRIAAKPRNDHQVRNYSEVHRAKSLVGIADALHGAARNTGSKN